MTKKKRIQEPPTIAMRLDEADKFALREVASRLGKSQTETVRVLVRERLASFPLANTTPKTALKVKR
jgi:hypothetical protein